MSSELESVRRKTEEWLMLEIKFLKSFLKKIGEDRLDYYNERDFFDDPSAIGGKNGKKWSIAQPIN